MKRIRYLAGHEPVGHYQMVTEPVKTANPAIGMHQEEPYLLLVKGGQIILQPGGTFDADDGRHVTFNASAKFTGGKNDKYGRYVIPAGMILELINDPEAIKKLKQIAK